MGVDVRHDGEHSRTNAIPPAVSASAPNHCVRIILLQTACRGNFQRTLNIADYGVLHRFLS